MILKRNLFTLYVGTLSAFFIFCLVLWQTASILPHSKKIRQLFLAENNVTEFLAVCFLISAILITVLAFWRSRKSRIYPLCWWLFPITIFLLLCDETSFGRVYYKWFTPPKVCGTKFDALHDILAILPGCLPYLAISKEAFVSGIVILVILLLAFVIYLGLKYKDVLLTFFKTNPVCLYLILAFVLFWIGGGIELISEIEFLNIEKSKFFVFLEEVFEMLAELTILFGAIAFYLRSSERRV